MRAILEALLSVNITEVKAMAVSDVVAYDPIYWQRESDGYLTGLEPDYTNKEALITYLEDYETLLGFTLPYELLPLNKEGFKGDISRVSIMAWAWDYHDIIRERIEEALGGLVAYKLHVDSGPLPERTIALQMGLAQRGRSQMLIHPEHGTAFYVGFILLKQSLESLVSGGFEPPNTKVGSALSAECLNCRKCQEHCPTGALFGESHFNGKRCISALTQKKGLLSEFESRAIRLQLYGCDHCQLSCPVNSPLFKTAAHKRAEPLVSEHNNALNPRDLLQLTQREFKRHYNKKGFTWRGLSVSKRNALINMANSQDQQWLPSIEGFINALEKNNQTESVLYSTAIWAADVLRKL